MVIIPGLCGRNLRKREAVWTMIRRLEAILWAQVTTGPKDKDDYLAMERAVKMLYRRAEQLRDA